MAFITLQINSLEDAIKAKAMIEAFIEMEQAIGDGNISKPISESKTDIKPKPISEPKADTKPKNVSKPKTDIKPKPISESKNVSKPNYPTLARKCQSLIAGYEDDLKTTALIKRAIMFLSYHYGVAGGKSNPTNNAVSIKDVKSENYPLLLQALDFLRDNYIKKNKIRTFNIKSFVENFKKGSV